MDGIPPAPPLPWERSRTGMRSQSVANDGCGAPVIRCGPGCEKLRLAVEGRLPLSSKLCSPDYLAAASINPGEGVFKPATTLYLAMTGLFPAENAPSWPINPYIFPDLDGAEKRERRMDMLTPADYADTYRNLEVALQAGSVNVKIERYHIGEADAEMGALVQAVKEYCHAQQKKDPQFTLELIVNGDKVNTNYEAVKLHVVAPFYGKGSPEDCQIAAQLAVLTKRTSKEHLAHYCDKYMGLDCNGFVGNYLFHVRNGNPWWILARDRKDLGPSSSMDQFVAAGHPVKDLGAINPANLHLFVEVDKALRVIPGGSSGAGHIVISQPNKYTPASFVFNSFGGLDMGYARKGAYGHPALWAVESTGPNGAIGLHESWYAIKKPVSTKHQTVNRGIYEVFRGSKAENRNFELVAIPPAKSAS